MNTAEEAYGISPSVPDYSREQKKWGTWDPSRSLLASIRCYQRYKSRNGILAFFLVKKSVLSHRFWSVVTGADIPLNCKIGGGLLIPHPNGIVIHPDSVIGPNCLIFQQVTIGMARNGVPSIGGHVDIGAGAKLLGSIHIGDHAVIGANAVVLQNVPEGAMAAGVPAQLKLKCGEQPACYGRVHTENSDEKIL